MQNNLKNLLRIVRHRSMQKVIYYNVNKEKGISPDVDALSYTTKGFLGPNTNNQMPRHLISDAHECVNEIQTVPKSQPAKLF